MTKNKNLSELRDELAKIQFPTKLDRRSDWSEGFDAAVKALAEISPEFDENWCAVYAEDHIDDFVKYCHENTFVEGARWQHSILSAQLANTIAAQRALLAECLARFDAYRGRDRNPLEDLIEKLKAFLEIK